MPLVVPPAPAGASPSRVAHRVPLAPLTGVRAVAALWVVALHLTVVIVTLFPGVAGRAFATAARPGALGVDIFYVLSGFIISYNYQEVFVVGARGAQVRRFLRTRLARIYPLHFVILVALFVVVKLVRLEIGDAIAPERWSMQGLLESLLLLQAWVGHAEVWNPVAWSISAEWFAYLLFPWYVRGCVSVARICGQRGTVACIMGLASLPLLHEVIARHTSIPAVIPLVRVGVEFGVGCLAYQCFAAGWACGIRAAPGVLLFVTVGGSTLLMTQDLPPHIVIPLIPLMLLGLAERRGALARWLEHPAFQYWGRASFALYMTHYLWLWVMRWALPLEPLAKQALPARVVWAAIHVLPMFIIAALAYHLVEEPSRRALAPRRPTNDHGVSHR